MVRNDDGQEFFMTRKVNTAQDLDERTLMEIAKRTGGRALPGARQQELATIYDTINQLEPVTNATKIWRPQQGGLSGLCLRQCSSHLCCYTGETAITALLLSPILVLGSCRAARRWLSRDNQALGVINHTSPLFGSWIERSHSKTQHLFRCLVVGRCHRIGRSSFEKKWTAKLWKNTGASCLNHGYVDVYVCHWY